MQIYKLVLVIFLLSLAGCVHNQAKTNAADEKPKKAEKAAPVPAPGSKFSKVSLGMSQEYVRKKIGNPDDRIHRRSGKSHIPFYFGQDKHYVTEYFYRNEGSLIFGSESLIEIIVDAKSKGHQ